MADGCHKAQEELGGEDSPPRNMQELFLLSTGLSYLPGPLGQTDLKKQPPGSHVGTQLVPRGGIVLGLETRIP